MTPISPADAPHYIWGTGCDGWRLCDLPNLSVIEERMPPGSAETRHVHDRAHQVFRVLSGTLTMLGPAGPVRIAEGQALSVPPDVPHQARNDGSEDARFLVISAPSTRHDRREAP
ncbi:MAG: cupin domain-containing protein [Pseudomonadota bacterium]